MEGRWLIPCVCLAPLLLGLVVHEGARGQVAGPPPKKIIEFGWDVPDTEMLREHMGEMETLPFDGVVFRLHAIRDDEKVPAYMVMTPTRIRREELTGAFEDLRQMRFSSFTDNFVLAWSTPGDADWFNDEHWDACCHNIALLAHAAKLGGCKGICFDPKPYGEVKPFDYGTAMHGKEKSYEEYYAQVRQRGGEFVEAMDPAAWNGTWQSATRKTSDGWSAELAIPWTCLEMSAPLSGEVLRTNVCRRRYPDDVEFSSWSPVYLEFDEPDCFGTWTFE